MYPFWYPQPYWCNYYFYKYPYRYPSSFNDLDDSYDEEHDKPEKNGDDEDGTFEQYRSVDKQDAEIYPVQDIQAEGEYVPSPPTQFPIGSLGYYGSIGEIIAENHSQTQQHVVSVEEIMSILDRSQPEILRTMALYRIPYKTAVDILRKIVETTLRYCR